MNDEQLLRYARHVMLDGIGIEGQTQLLGAHALVLGAGGLGCAAALYLASAGVGHITLVDNDVVDLTNLQRQIGHTMDRLGQAKVQSLATAMRAINPDIRVTAVAQRADLVLIDTAGRLHNKVNLMNELAKIKRVMSKVVPEAPHEVWLVLDGSTGQNALEQAKRFTEVTDVTGLVLTKLDGTAKGGVVLAISDQLNVPVRFVGVGEKMEDLQEFHPMEFVDSLLPETLDSAS